MKIRPSVMQLALVLGVSCQIATPALPTTIRGGEHVSKSVGVGSDHTLAFLHAAHQGTPGEVARMIEGGVDVNASDDYGVTALFLAAERGNKETVELLLLHGAAVNKRTRPNPFTGRGAMTPLMAAAINGHADVVSLLVQHGADTSAETGEIAPHPCGVTALYLATVKGHDDVVAILNQEGTAGEKWWKYWVVMIWILEGIFIMAQRNCMPDKGSGKRAEGPYGQ